VLAEEGVAAGFSLSVVTDEVPNARQMAETESGLLLVGSRSAGNLYAVTLAPGGDAEVVTFATGLKVPSGIALIGDDLYVAALNRVLRYRDIERTYRNRPRPEVVTALLIRPTVTSRTAVMIDVLIPSIRAREIRFGPILLGVNQLTATSVARAAQTA